MSDFSPDVSQLTALYSNSVLSNRVFLSGAGDSTETWCAIQIPIIFLSCPVIVFYDYALTLPAEISEVWNSKFSGAQVLFFLTRYSFIVRTALEFGLSFRSESTDLFCRGIYYTRLSWTLLSQIGLLSIFALRTYAIYQRKKWILVTLFLISAAVWTIALCLNGILLTPVADQFGLAVACLFASSTNFSSFQLASLISTVVLDVLIFGLTFWKTIGHAIEMKKVGLGNSLGYFILRDGTMYFLAKMLISISAITVNRFPGVQGSLGSIVPSIGNVLTVILVNRLVLNLRQVSHIQEVNPTFGTFQAEPEFAGNSLIGNLGAPLGVDPDNDILSGVPAENEIVEEFRSFSEN